jgi:hypothetical protein
MDMRVAEVSAVHPSNEILKHPKYNNGRTLTELVWNIQIVISRYCSEQMLSWFIFGFYFIQNTFFAVKDCAFKPEVLKGEIFQS